MPEPTFLDVLALEERGGDRFLTRHTAGEGPGRLTRAGRSRLFGGQVAAQALRAAALTVPADRYPHSVHCSFVGEGPPDEPIELDVVRVRDGRSFSNRLATASLGGRQILTLVASFHIGEPGVDVPAPAPSDVPGPEEVAHTEEASGNPLWGSQFQLCRVPLTGTPAPLAPAVRFWVRSRPALPADPVVAACVLVYTSDMHTARAAALVTGEPEEMRGPLTSLDHAMWLHRPADPNDWFLVDVRPVSTAASRGLVFGTVHTRSGVHVASFTQEILVRRPPG